MDWANRWFLCKECCQYIRTPSAFLDHKKQECQILNSKITPQKEPDPDPNPMNPRKQRPMSQSEPSDETSKDGKTEKKFKCKFCVYSSDLTSCFKQHLLSHSTDRPFVCNLCNFACKRPDHLKKHSRFHSGETPFKCQECKASFNTGMSLGVHVSRQHPLDEDEAQPNFDIITDGGDGTTKKFKCQLCEYFTVNRKDVKDHVRAHTGVKPFVCKLCNHAFKQRSQLIRHRRCHTGQTPFKCSECPATFNTRRSLGLHFAGQHEERGPEELASFVRRSSKGESTACRFCSKVISSVHNKKLHERIHTGERPFKCKKCSADFTLKGNLDKHMLIHGETKQFKCDHCDFACHRKQSLMDHVGLHTGEKPYKCNVCEAAFTGKSNFKRHIRNHNNRTGIRAYACKLCNYTCKRLQCLKLHIRIHTGEKPFKCDLCEFAAANRSHLNRHRLARKHTNKIKPESVSLLAN